MIPTRRYDALNENGFGLKKTQFPGEFGCLYRSEGA
jgi:hypothetical protein